MGVEGNDRWTTDYFPCSEHNGKVDLAAMEYHWGLMAKIEAEGQHGTINKVDTIEGQDSTR